MTEGLAFQIGNQNGVGSAAIQGMTEEEEMTILSAVLKMIRGRLNHRLAADRERLALAAEYGPPNDLI